MPRVRIDDSVTASLCKLGPASVLLNHSYLMRMPAVAQSEACGCRSHVAEAADYEGLSPQHEAELPERIDRCTRFYGIFMLRACGVIFFRLGAKVR